MAIEISLCSLQVPTELAKALFFLHFSLHQSKSLITPCLHSDMSEPPFRPREKLFEHQKYYQSVRKYTHLKGPYDMITSVAIPLFLAGSSVFLIGRGIYNMSHGIGKKA
ncbi:hypothetical protein PIB30_051464 [Stylosanthes scabra]|uniref:Uncharacterized protein n=1 Tax=Stylosanthes scabra TaxID=79078 RepID=A0ABU6UHA4_9FABA|nr:hypothetical protein [Stylosanthes scabra]